MTQVVGQIDDGYGWNPERINGWKTERRGRRGRERRRGEEKDG
jgi:hypothetical protein